MCGINGYISSDSDMDRKKILEDMTERIYRRGPDDVGYFLDEDAALGMRRLSIIGIENGRQPIFNEDESLVLVYNGEVYNYRELKSELMVKGHVFTTDTDSEVIIHGYEEYGFRILDRLRGMFAFAIWDRSKKELFIARDPFGIKPMYYAIIGQEIVFASEIKSILAYPHYEKKFNEAALPAYLSFQYNVMHETFFKGIYQLFPAHYLVWNDGGVNITRYYKPRFDPDEEMTEEEAVALLDSVMMDSLDKHQISDVEVGSFLSGGVDSSFIAAAAKPQKTFSIGFEGNQYNETEFARELSDKLGLENHSRIISASDYWDALNDVLYFLDEPVADPSIIPLYYLSQMASKYVKVVMSGEGSDELFGGYNIYQTVIALRSVEKIPFCIRKVIRNIMEKLPFDFKGRQYLIRAGQSVEERFIGNAYIFSPKEVKKVLRDTVSYREPSVYTRPYYDEVKGLDDITKMQYIDINFWLRGDILHKSDRMSMANSLEVRVPFMDMEVAKAAYRIPSKLKVSDKATKIAFRNMAGKYLPDASAKRKKLGFPVPIRVWLRQDDYYDRVYRMFTSRAAGRYFNKDELIRLLDYHRANKKDYSRKIWTVYIFLLWYDINFGCNK